MTPATTTRSIRPGYLDDSGVLLHPLCHGLQPALGGLAVRVEEDNEGTGGGSRSRQPRLDQTKLAWGAHQANLGVGKFELVVEKTPLVEEGRGSRHLPEW